MLCASAAAGGALLLTELDDRLDTSFVMPFLFTGGPESARALLSAIITSMISFTGLVFSITIVALQLTSSQFSPRVMRTFLRDLINQMALGIFVATFVYALVVLRAVRGTSQVEPFVPQVSMTVAFGFMLGSVVVFLVYIHHIAQSLRAATIIKRIAQDTRELLEHRCPADAEAAPSLALPEGRGRRVSADGPGVVQWVDDLALQRVAEEHAVTICLLRAVGEFVPAGGDLVAIHGPGTVNAESVRGAIHVGAERSLQEDVAFGLRQLVDIAERALSPGVNDPTTAVQVIDQLHDLLRRLGTRALRPRQTLTDEGGLAVDVPQPKFDEYLALAVDEISRSGSDADRIQYRLRVMLEDLHEVVLPEHRPSIVRAQRSLPGGTRLAHEGTGEPPTDVGLR